MIIHANAELMQAHTCSGERAADILAGRQAGMNHM